MWTAQKHVFSREKFTDSLTLYILETFYVYYGRPPCYSQSDTLCFANVYFCRATNILERFTHSLVCLSLLWGAKIMCPCGFLKASKINQVQKNHHYLYQLGQNDLSLMQRSSQLRLGLLSVPFSGTSRF